MEGSVLTQTIISAGILPYLLLIPAVLSFSGSPVEISFMNFANQTPSYHLRCSLPSYELQYRRKQLAVEFRQAGKLLLSKFF